jgi:hypothetical protein
MVDLVQQVAIPGYTVPLPSAPPSGYYDYRWNASVAVMAAYLLTIQATVIGPVVVGSISYVAIRSSTVLALPANVSVTDPSLSVGLIGMFAADPGAAPATYVPQPVYVIPAYEWLNLIPVAIRAEIEVAAVQMAVAGDGRLAAGLTALGTATAIDLRDPDGQLALFLAICVAATASTATPLTNEIVTTIMTPGVM